MVVLAFTGCTWPRPRPEAAGLFQNWITHLLFYRCRDDSIRVIDSSRRQNTNKFETVPLYLIDFAGSTCLFKNTLTIPWFECFFTFFDTT